jgi:hypothetical protein
VRLDFILRSPGSLKQGNDTIKHLSLEDRSDYSVKNETKWGKSRSVRSPGRRLSPMSR